MIGLLLHPEDAVVMGSARDQIGSPGAVDVRDVYESRSAQVEVAVPHPFAVPGIGRRFEPAIRSKDVRTPIAVYITGADAMPVAFIAHLMLDEFAAAALIPGKRRIQVAELRQDLLCLAVVIQVNKKRKLDGRTRFDHVLGPHSRFFVPPPTQRLAKPRTTDHVETAVAIDV